MCVTFGSGTTFQSIITTDWFRYGGLGCTDSFTGTSAAAPMAAGVIALMLQVRPCLTWRDVQYILALTAVPFNGTRKYTSHEKARNYLVNGAKLRHNDYHGFGLLDAWRAVQVARVWSLVPPMKTEALPAEATWLGIRKWPNMLTSSATVRDKEHGITTIEHTLVRVRYEHPRRGALEFRLTSPAGTAALLVSRRQFDWNSGRVEWTFTTVQFFGESPVGVWSFQITDRDRSDPGYLHEWQLRFTGSNMTQQEFADRRRLAIDICEGRLHVEKSLKCPVIERLASTRMTVSLSFGITAGFILLFLLLMFIGVKKIRFVYNVNAENNSEMLELQHPLLQGSRQSEDQRRTLTNTQ